MDKKEVVSKFHYNLNRFSSSMDQYSKYLKTMQVCRANKQIAEKNEQGLMKSDQLNAIQEWTDHFNRSEKLSEEQLNIAIESFDAMKKLIKSK